MGRYRKLMSNTLLFAIGNLGNKFIGFFLVPFYTFYLSASEFGTIDLLTTTTGLLLPVFSFGIFDAVLRFTMEGKEQTKILSSSLMVVFLGMLLSILCYPLLTFLPIPNSYFLYFYLLLFLQGINAVFMQFIRATNKMKLFTISSLLTTVVTLLLAVFFLKYYQLGMTGYLFTLIGAGFFSMVLLFFAGKIYQDIDIKAVDTSTMRTMLLYSLPLIPNSLMWWLMQLSDRYMIAFFLGAGANGLFAVANKIPSLLSMVHAIFFQAWQLAAIEERDSGDKTTFFNHVFSMLFAVMVLSTSAILLILKFVIGHLIAPEFYDSWQYVPFLLISVIFSSFSGFLGTNYIAMKKTSGVLKTSVVGAVVSVVSNLILLPAFGLNGASFSIMLSFFVIWVLRMIDTRKFVTIRIHWLQFVLSFFVLFLQIGLLYVGGRFEYLWGAGLFVLLMVIQVPTYRVVRELFGGRRGGKRVAELLQ